MTNKLQLMFLGSWLKKRFFGKKFLRVSRYSQLLIFTLTYHSNKLECYIKISWGHIFSFVQPSYERAVSNLDRYMHQFLCVLAAHSLFIDGLHMTKNKASERLFRDKHSSLLGPSVSYKEN